MAQNPRRLEDDFIPLEEDFIALEDTPEPTKPQRESIANVPQEEKSWWDTITTPLTDAPSRFIKGNITPGFQKLRETMENPNFAGAIGFYEGAAEGLGNYLTEATSPLALGLEAIGGGIINRIRKGYRAARKLAGVADEAAEINAAMSSVSKTPPKATPVSKEIPKPTDSDLGGFKDFKSLEKRMYELTDKGTAGTLTGEELAEAQKLNKIWRNHPEFNKPATKQGDPGSVVTKEKPKIRANNDGTFSPVDQPHLKYDKSGKLLTRTAGGSVPPNAPRLTAEATDSPSMKRQIYDLARGSLSVDLPGITSAGLRQAMPHVGTANWFKAWVPQFKAFGSELAYNAHLDSIKSRELFKPRPVIVDGKPLVRNGKPVMRDSYAEEAGLRLAEITKYSQREEVLRNGLAEKVPAFGKWVKASNRSYTAFLNDLRASAFEDLIDNARSIAKSTGDTALDPDANALLRKEIAEFVNNTTGAGSLNFKGPKGTSLNLERHANALSEIMFSARNTASRMQMMNPFTYTQASPMVRKQYMNAALRTALFWSSMAGLGKMAETAGLPVEVRANPTSSDFGKLRFGNTRLDPAGGFQQFVVHLARQMMQQSTPTTDKMGQKDTPEEYGGPGPFDPSFGREAWRFAKNKLHPTIGLALSLAEANKKNGIEIPDRILQTYVPMVAQDIMELVNEDPKLLALLPFISAGMGANTFEKGDFGKPKMISNDAIENFVNSVTGLEIPDLTFRGNIWNMGRQ